SPNSSTTITFRISSSPLKRLQLVLVTESSSLRGENGITLHVNPIRSPCRDMATEAILLVVGCNLLVGGVGVEQSPAPAVSPQRIVRIASFAVFDHHEPDFGSRSPVHVAGRHLRMIGSEHFFHEDG